MKKEHKTNPVISMPVVIAANKDECKKIGDKIVMYNSKKYYILNNGPIKYALVPFDKYFDYLEYADKELQKFVESKND